MEKEFKEEVFKGWSGKFRDDQVDFLRSLNNASKYMRWRLDNDLGYQKYMRERKNEDVET